MILLVSSDPQLRLTVQQTFKGLHQVVEAIEEQSAVEILKTQSSFDAIIVDLKTVSPGFLEKHRDLIFPSRVVVVGNQDFETAVHLLQGGQGALATRYVVDPPQRTVLRESVEEAQEMDVHGFVINRFTRLAYYRLEPIDVSEIQFDLLWLLLQQYGRFVKYQFLAEKIYNRKFESSREATVRLKQRVAELRDALKKVLGYDPIRTEYGRGLRLILADDKENE